MQKLNSEYDLTTAEGAAVLLDDRAPERWYHRIDLGRLDQNSTSDCVAGQIFGTYSDGLEYLGVPLFTDAFDGTVGTEEWRYEIQKRLTADPRPGDRNQFSNLEVGKKYRVTLTLEYSYVGGESLVAFRDSQNDTMVFLKRDVVSIDPVPWKVYTGDVYLRDGEVYHVKDVTLHGATFRAGDAAHFVTRDMNFTEDELIYRKDPFE